LPQTLIGKSGKILDTNKIGLLYTAYLEQMTYRVNGENIVVQASCPGLVYLITTGTAV